MVDKQLFCADDDHNLMVTLNDIKKTDDGASILKVASKKESP